MSTLDYILEKYKINPKRNNPIQIDKMNRDDLARLFYQLRFKIGVEVGTYRGEYAEVLCRNNPLLKLSCVDPYIGYSNHKQEDLNDAIVTAKDRLNKYGAVFQKARSIETSNFYEDDSLDFVYIDGDHTFRQVVDDIDSWSRKVKKNGIVAGHDYIRRVRPTKTHVIEAVDGFTRSYNIKPLFITDRPPELKGKNRDFARSWFYVKQ